MSRALIVKVMVDSQRFVDLRRPRRIWAVAAIHAEINRLVRLHDDLGTRFRPGDRLIYLGNMIGRGAAVTETIEELLMFRRALLAVPGLLASDIIYLRGGQEEIWQKLLQVQLAPNLREVMAWMRSQGVDSTLAAYGSNGEQATLAVRDGIRTTTRFTNGLRAAMRAAPGHETLFSELRRAAYTTPSPMAPLESKPATDPETKTETETAVEVETEPGGPAPGQGGVLFVSAGIDPGRDLRAQGDAFWWGGPQFARLEHPYRGFAQVVRGHDPSRGGFVAGKYTTTLDAGCGFGGPLVCGCLTPTGDLLDTLEA